MVDPVALDRVAQRPHDVLLADHVGEGAGTVAPVERGRGRGHGTVSLVAAEDLLGGTESGPCTLRRGRFPGRVRWRWAPARATPLRLPVTA